MSAIILPEILQANFIIEEFEFKFLEGKLVWFKDLLFFMIMSYFWNWKDKYCRNYGTLYLKSWLSEGFCLATASLDNRGCRLLQDQTLFVSEPSGMPQTTPEIKYTVAQKRKIEYPKPQGIEKRRKFNSIMLVQSYPNCPDLSYPAPQLSMLWFRNV